MFKEAKSKNIQKEELYTMRMYIRQTLKAFQHPQPNILNIKPGRHL